MTSRVEGLALVERAAARGRIHLALVDDSRGAPRDASSLTIDPLVLSDGAGGALRVDGIGNVATLQEYRGRGLASSLLEVAIERMRSGDAVGSLLYGIDGFYEPFGWRTCGDERWVVVSTARQPASRRRSPERSRMTIRRMRASDLPQLEAAYGAIAARRVGAVLRPRGGRTWSQLDVAEVLVAHEEDELRGWAWRGRGTSEHGIVADHVADADGFVELQALDVDAAWHVLDAALDWTRTEHPAVRSIAVGAPDGHPLRDLVRDGHVDARLIDDHRARGGAMLLPFTDAAAPLLHDSYQFVPDRF